MGTFIRILVVTLASVAVVQPAPENVGAVSCTISRYNEDDITNAQRECSQLIIDGIEVPAGVTLDLTHLKEGSRVVFRGTTTWGYKEWRGPLISLAGNNVDISGASGHVLDGRGNLWWDGKGSNGGKRKPRFIDVQLTNSEIRSLIIRNTPLQAIHIDASEGLTLIDIMLDSYAGESGGAQNTDGFVVSNSANVTIKDSTIYNQDDCLRINSGENVEFANNYCSGGNGISIGDVGGRSNNDVTDIKISGSIVTNANYGIRIKTVYGATGTVSDITFQDITMSRIHKYGIAIEGDYENGRPTGTPTGGVPIKGLTVNEVRGFIDSVGINVYILVENASNWYFSNIELSGGQKAQKCEGIPAGAGITC